MTFADYVDKFPEVRVAYMALLWTIQQMQQVFKKKPRVDLCTAGKNFELM